MRLKYPLQIYYLTWREERLNYQKIYDMEYYQKNKEYIKKRNNYKHYIKKELKAFSKILI